MNGPDHRKVVELAVDSLPDRSRVWWAPRTAAMLATCMYPDEYAIPYLTGESGPWRKYFPATAPHSFEKVGVAARAHFFDTAFYVDSILARAAADDWAEACRFLGVLSHCLGDFGEPAHYHEREITLLAVPPPPKLNCNPHRMLEDVVSSIAALDHTPRVLGDDAGTIRLRLEGHLRELYERALGTIVPMLTALYVDDQGAAARLVDPVVGATAAIFADMLHTLWCLTMDGWTVAEQDALRSCRLDLVEPLAYDVEFNYGCRPLRDAITIDAVGKAMPFAGLCLVPHALPIGDAGYESSITFALPAGAFARFRGRVGLLPGVAPQAVCRFAVETAAGEVYRSEPRTADDPALCLDLDIGGSDRLRLVTYTDGSTDKLAYPIWTEPTVERID